MSGHRVYVWKTLESSKDLSTFAGVVADLQKQLPGPGTCDSAVLAFAQRLQSLVRLTPNVDAGFLAAFGDLVREAQTSDSAVLSMELPEGNEEKGWKVVTETAGLLGLSVFNDIKLDLFDNRISTTVPMQQAGCDDNEYIDCFDRVDSLKSFDAWARPRLTSFFVAHGFSALKIKSGTQKMYKKQGISDLYINFDFKNRGGGYNCYISAEIHCDEINKIVKKYGFYGPPVTVDFNCFTGPRWEKGIVKHYDDFHDLLKYVDGLLIPLVKAAASLKTLDDAVNGDLVPVYREIIHKDVYPPQCLILAWICSRKDIIKLKEKLEQVDNWGQMSNLGTLNGKN